METREDILKELREIAPKLALLEKANTYQLPDNYFLNFTNNMLQQVKPVDVKQELQVLAPSLLKIEKPANAEIPAAYFTDFSGRLIKQVRAGEVAKELATVAPLLSQVQKTNTLEAPANYFSSFADRALGNVTAHVQAPVTSPNKLVESLNEFLDGIFTAIFKPRYTIAFAGLTTIVIVGVLMFAKVQQSDNLDSRFAQLSTAEIDNYLNNKSDAYTDAVFEVNIDIKGLTDTLNVTGLHPYKDALKNVDDAALDDAIAD